MRFYNLKAIIYELSLVPFALIIALSPFQPSYGSPITENPYNEFLEKKSKNQRPLLRFFYDLNSDGNKELFVAKKPLDGNDLSGEFHVFQKLKSGYKKLGQIYLNPYKTYFTNRKNFNMKQIYTYWNISNQSNIQIIYLYDGKVYKNVKSKKIIDPKKLKSLKVPFKVEESDSDFNWSFNS